ncbi:MAG: peptide deformylase [Bacteroidia bacterium]|jgi:peptide deformylase|nr:peptide deformylase [Bacteroidia bacterium]
MILPIVAYGDPVLRKKAVPLTKDYDGLEMLIDSMWETMYESNGVGLAAPQIGKSLNLFVVDAGPMQDADYPEFKKVFINAEIIEEFGEKWEYEEGCLSIPHIRDNVKRYSDIAIRYWDEHFVEHEEEFHGMPARVIQHEYDHIKGVLFVDHLSELRKRLLKNKLITISKGGVEVDYKMRFPSTR